MAEGLERPQTWEELPHTADVGLRVRGSSPEEVLARLVVVLGHLLTGERGALLDAGQRVVEVEAGDRALMAVDVLRDLLYAFDTERVVPRSCQTDHVDPGRGARARVGLGRYDARAHAEGLDIKAVTLHAARFEPEDGGWVAEVVFDI